MYPCIDNDDDDDDDDDGDVVSNGVSDSVMSCHCKLIRSLFDSFYARQRHSEV